ncbi:hypothetical protein [Dyella sp.]|uniref:hypothetical protein n=1 Tax=Dyella sp. TaxID=1869338 RepID=UPI002D79CDDB|nr:hypothetical protein [Dyella sp.]HET6432717.1 hypothetical protein [Dyella sp.]
MRAYVVVTGCLFALIVMAHVARLIAEGFAPLHEPIFLIATLGASGMTVWAAVIVRGPPVPRSP